MKEIVIAILAKDKGYCLDFYLTCILNQTYDKKKIHLWIRTNDNNDNTESILNEFVKTHGEDYLSVYYNNDPILSHLKDYDEHEWNPTRFNILADIRQSSINYAIEKNAHYFVVDCDNFITKTLLSDLYNTRSLGCIGPMLFLSPYHYYSNFHNVADIATTYFAEQPEYYTILGKKIKGKIEVDTLHCTYFINNNILKDVEYSDGGDRYEYAIFSDTLRRKGIPQYLDNSKFYGFLFLSDQIKLDFSAYIEKYWKSEYNLMINTEGYYDFVEIGTCDFETIIGSNNPGKGISVEALPYYFNNLPDVNGVKKINSAISDENGEISFWWVKPETIKKFNLPWWVKGSSCIGGPHEIVLNQINRQGINVHHSDIFTEDKIKVKSWKTLAKENNIKHATIIKLDTEGHESKILQNMYEDMLERSDFRPSVIKFEQNKLATDTDIDIVISRISSLGYAYERISRNDAELRYRSDSSFLIH